MIKKLVESNELYEIRYTKKVGGKRQHIKPVRSLIVEAKSAEDALRIANVAKGRKIILVNIEKYNAGKEKKEENIAENIDK